MTILEELAVYLFYLHEFSRSKSKLVVLETQCVITTLLLLKDAPQSIEIYIRMKLGKKGVEAGCARPCELIRRRPEKGLCRRASTGRFLQYIIFNVSDTMPHEPIFASW